MAVKISSLSSGSLNGIGNKEPVSHTDKLSHAFSTDSANYRHTDTVSLTGTAAQLQQLENRISNMPIVDAQKVKEVQRQLATGSFRVDPESTASKLLMLESSLP